MLRYLLVSHHFLHLVVLYVAVMIISIKFNFTFQKMPFYIMVRGAEFVPMERDIPSCFSMHDCGFRNSGIEGF